MVSRDMRCQTVGNYANLSYGLLHTRHNSDCYTLVSTADSRVQFLPRVSSV